jgi:tetratricopeptide (TPR) repeat protein
MMKSIWISYCFLFLTVGLLNSCKEAETKTNIPKDLDSLIVMFPDSIELLIKRGNLKLKAYDYPQAMADGAKAFRLDSNNLEARMLYADVLNNRPERTVEEITQAQGHYLKIIKKDPKNQRGLVGLASTFSQQMDFERSFHYINEALKINPRYRDAYIMKGSNYLVLSKLNPEKDGQAGKKYLDLAKSSYETSVQQDPEFYEAYLLLGSLYQAENNPICLEYYTTAAALQPKNAEVLYPLAYAKQEFGKRDEAIELYRKMIQLDTTNAEALFQIGYIKQFYVGELDSAIYYYNSSLQTEPRYVEAWHNLGLCYETKGDKTMALKSYAKALKYNPDFELSRKQADALR